MKQHSLAASKRGDAFSLNSCLAFFVCLYVMKGGGVAVSQVPTAARTVNMFLSRSS